MQKVKELNYFNLSVDFKTFCEFFSFFFDVAEIFLFAGAF